MTITPRFTFYEKVRIHSIEPAKSHLDGEFGTILGRTLTEDNKTWLYAVWLDSEQMTWSFNESELEGTGEYGQREDLYDGSKLRVVVDDSGEGKIVSQDEHDHG